MRAPNLKRKSGATSRFSTNKRARAINTSSDLPWRAVPRSLDTAGDGDDGVFELEEVDNVRVIYEETDAGRVAKFEVFFQLFQNSVI